MRLTKDLLWLFELFANWRPLPEVKLAAASAAASASAALQLRRDKAVKRAKRDGKADARPLLPGLDFSAEN